MVRTWVVPSSWAAYFSRAASPMTKQVPSSSRMAYSMSGPTARARLLGRVHGVVVHARIFIGPGSSGSGTSVNDTVSAGSCRGRVASSRRISMLDSGVSAPHEYGMTRYDS